MTTHPIPLIIIVILMVVVVCTLYHLQRTEQVTRRLQFNKQPFQFLPGGKFPVIPDHYGPSWDFRAGTGGLQVFCQPTGGLGTKLFTLATSIALCAHKGLGLNGILLKRVVKDPGSDDGPYDVLPPAFFTGPGIPTLFKDVFIYTNVLYLNYRSASSLVEEEAVLDGMFPGVMMVDKTDDHFVSVELPSYSTQTTCTHIICGQGWRNWRYWYNYEKVVLDALTMHGSILEYCREHYQYVYDPSFHVMGIFANFVRQKNGQIEPHVPPVDPALCARCIRILYQENPKMKRIVVLVFTPDDATSREYYGQLFGIDGVHPVFIKENPYVILQLCRALRYIIPDSGNLSWWGAYMGGHQGAKVMVPYGYSANNIHPYWRVV